MLRELASIPRFFAYHMLTALNPVYWWHHSQYQSPFKNIDGLIGVLISFALPSVGYQDKASNEAVRATVADVGGAMAKYAELHHGALPAKDRWLAEVGALLPERRLPASPWGRVAQTGSLGVPPAEAALPGARVVAGGAKLPEYRTPLGDGHEAKEAGEFDGRTYGAILYDVDPAAHVAVLYGIGKFGNDAVVAAALKVGPVQRR